MVMARSDGIATFVHRTVRSSTTEIAESLIASLGEQQCLEISKAGHGIMLVVDQHSGIIDECFHSEEERLKARSAQRREGLGSGVRVLEVQEKSVRGPSVPGVRLSPFGKAVDN